MRHRPTAPFLIATLILACAAAIAGDPKNVMARASLAELYMRQNDNAKAEATLRQASEEMSDSESGAGMLATYYIRTNQLVPGAAAYADLVAKHPKSTPLDRKSVV